jgi:hypothetical protein
VGQLNAARSYDNVLSRSKDRSRVGRSRDCIRVRFGTGLPYPLWKVGIRSPRDEFLTSFSSEVLRIVDSFVDRITD